MERRCDPLFIGGGGARSHVIDPGDLHHAPLDQTAIESKVEIMGMEASWTPGGADLPRT